MARTVELPAEVATKLSRNGMRVEQYGELLHHLRLDKQAASVRRLVRKNQDGTLGQPDNSEGSTMPDEEDEKVILGDTTNTYNITEASPGQPTGLGTPAIAGAARSVMPLVLAAALGAGGLGTAAGVLVPMLMRKQPEQPAATMVDTDTDTNTRYVLEFGE